MLILYAEGKGLVPLQLHLPNFVDFPWEPLTLGRSVWEMGCGERWGGEMGRGMRGKLWMKYEIRFKK